MKYKIKYEDKIFEYESLKIAIVKLSAMGDIIHAMIVLQFLKKFDPTIQIDWIVENSFAPILENNPHITNIYKVNLKNLKKQPLNIFREIARLRAIKKNRYDLVIDAQGLIKSAFVTSLIGDFTSGFSKNSTREKLASIFYNEKINSEYSKNVIERNIDVVCKSIGLDIDKTNILEKEPFLFFENYDLSINNLLKEDKKNIIFVVGASKENKIYSKEKFASLAKKLDENILVLWGNADEKNMAEYICANSNATLLPKIDLNTLKALISKVDLVIGNDTGPTHMAWALNIPSITLFGNTPGYRNTYTTDINKIIESSSLVDPCKLDHNDFSINEIDEEEILKVAKGIL